MNPVLLITIDTEGDNSWSRPTEITTRNSLFLPRFQCLCEKFQFKPAYLTNYEMAIDDAYVEFAKDTLARGHAEIGMHLHAWHSPPYYDLTGNDFYYQPYLIEYPNNILYDKIQFMTDLLEDVFEVKMLSHRAGRWAINSIYAKTLVDLGYKIDCSVTPCVDWRLHQGSQQGQGGVDYRGFPNQEYFMDMDSIHTQGSSDLLELPMTIMQAEDNIGISYLRSIPVIRAKINRRRPSPVWFRPNGHNRKAMKSVLDHCIGEGRPYVEFMTHSSELMPGGCPTFPDQRSIDKLYFDLEDVLSYAQSLGFVGMTPANYRQIRYQETLA